MNCVRAWCARIKSCLVNIFQDTHFMQMIKNAGWLGSAMPFTMAAGILKTALLARLLGVKGLGAYGLVVSFTSILTLVFGFSSTEAVITFTNKALESKNRILAAEIVKYCLYFDFFLSLTTYLTLLWLSYFFAGWFHLEPYLKSVLMLYGLNLVVNATQWVARGILELFNYFRYNTYMSIVKSWSFLLLLFIIYLIRGDLLMIVSAEVFVSFIVSVILLFLVFRVLHAHDIYLKMANRKWWQVSRRIWHYQLYGYLRTSVKGVNRHLALLILGYLTTPTEVGLYDAAKRLTDPIRNSAQIFVHSLYPQYGRFWFSNKVKELKKLFKQSAFLFFVLSIGIIVVLGPMMKIIIHFLYGNGFSASVIPAEILLVVAATIIITVPLNALLPAVGVNRPHLIASTIMLFVQIVFLFFLAKKFGATGAALSFLFAVLSGTLYLLPKTISILRARLTKVAMETIKRGETDKELA